MIWSGRFVAKMRLSPLASIVEARLEALPPIILLLRYCYALSLMGKGEFVKEVYVSDAVLTKHLHSCSSFSFKETRFWWLVIFVVFLVWVLYWFCW